MIKNYIFIFLLIGFWWKMTEMEEPFWPRSSKSLKLQQQWTAFGVKRETLIWKFNRELMKLYPRNESEKKKKWWIGIEIGNEGEEKMVEWKERNPNPMCKENNLGSEKMVKDSEIYEIAKLKRVVITILNFLWYQIYLLLEKYYIRGIREICFFFFFE